MLSFDADSKIILFEEDRSKVPKRYNIAEVRSCVKGLEGATSNFIISLNKAFSNYRDVYDGSEHYSSPTCSSESPAGGSKRCSTHSRTTRRSLPSADNKVELKGLLHENIQTHLTEVI